MSLFNVKKTVIQIPKNVYYMKNVNISYSFSTLSRIAKDLDAELLNGDMLIVDNEKGDKRKIFKMTPHGAIILYAGLNKLTFDQLEVDTKSIVKDTRQMLECFESR